MSQAFIYTVTLSFLIQKTSPEFRNTLWRLCGYGGKIYSNVKFNSVVAIPEKSKKLYERELKKMASDVEDSNISVKYLVYRVTDKYKIDIIDTDLIA